MNKIKKIILLFIILLFIILFLIPIQVNAKNCSKEEMSRINIIINNIELSYEHKEDNYFIVNAYNVSSEFYIADAAGNKFVDAGNNVLTTYGYIGGKSYTFYIYSTTNNPCVDDMKYSKTIFIRKYNEYSEKEICKNSKYKDFKLCNKWYQGNITDEKFKKELKKFEETITIQKVEKEKENNNVINQQIIYIIVITSISLLTSLIILYIKFKRRRRKI